MDHGWLQLELFKLAVNILEMPRPKRQKRQPGAKPEGKLLQMPEPIPDGVPGTFQEAHALAETDPYGAIQMYLYVAKHDPTQRASSFLNIGTLLYNQQRYNEAQKYYRKSLELEPNHPLAHYNLGNALEEMHGARAAIPEYEKAIELNPKFGDAYFNLGLAYELIGETGKALRAFQTFIKVAPGDPQVTSARQEIRRMQMHSGLRPA